MFTLWIEDSSENLGLLSALMEPWLWWAGVFFFAGLGMGLLTGRILRRRGFEGKGKGKGEGFLLTVAGVLLALVALVVTSSRKGWPWIGWPAPLWLGTALAAMVLGILCGIGGLRGFLVVLVLSFLYLWGGTLYLQRGVSLPETSRGTLSSHQVFFQGDVNRWQVWEVYPWWLWGRSSLYLLGYDADDGVSPRGEGSFPGILWLHRPVEARIEEGRGLIQVVLPES